MTGCLRAAGFLLYSYAPSADRILAEQSKLHMALANGNWCGGNGSNAEPAAAPYIG